MAWNLFRRKKKLSKRVLLGLDTLDKLGWARNNGQVFVEGKACLWTATTRHTVSLEEVGALRSAIEAVIGDAHIFDWNDARGRTEDEVRDAIRDTSLILKARGL